jgi:hypothetical protein
MKTVLMCAVVAVLGGGTGPRGPAVSPVVQTNPSPAVPDEKPANQDRREGQRPICTLIVVPADPGIDAGFAQPVERQVDPGMVVPSWCRP